MNFLSERLKSSHNRLRTLEKLQAEPPDLQPEVFGALKGGKTASSLSAALPGMRNLPYLHTFEGVSQPELMETCCCL